MPSFHSITCFRCKVSFGMDEATYQSVKKSEQSFHCPWGHSQYFPLGPTEAEQLRLERDRLKQEQARLHDRNRELRDERDAAERRASAARGQVTRIKNRAAAGVCPCCNRTFQNLARHMATKHAGFAAEEVTPEGATVQ